MRDQYINSGQGFVVVYSITCRESFDAIPELRNKILQVCMPSKTCRPFFRPFFFSYLMWLMWSLDDYFELSMCGSGLGNVIVFIEGKEMRVC